MKKATIRSSKGPKLYAVRDAQGRFKDIKAYQKRSAAPKPKTKEAL